MLPRKRGKNETRRNSCKNHRERAIDSNRAITSAIRLFIGDPTLLNHDSLPRHYRKYSRVSTDARDAFCINSHFVTPLAPHPLVFKLIIVVHDTNVAREIGRFDKSRIINAG